jgi:hypothetical protein
MTHLTWRSEVIAKEMFKLPHQCKAFVALRNCITPRGECHRYLLQTGDWLNLKCASEPTVRKTIIFGLESKNDSPAFQPLSLSLHHITKWLTEFEMSNRDAVAMLLYSKRTEM